MNSSKPNLHADLDNFREPGGMFDVEPCEMDLEIGRRGQYVAPDTTQMGTISLEPFEVVGVQNNYKGEKCWRICHDSDTHRFGSVLNPKSNFRWIGGIIHRR